MKTPTSFPDHVDIICFSHLRWNFVFQRPQHLMSRFAKSRRVFFVEEPIDGAPSSALDIHQCSATKVWVVTPRLHSESSQDEVLEGFMAELVRSNAIDRPLLWFYTPMSLSFLPSTIVPSVVVYDCMDDLSLFRGAPPELREKEAELLRRCDLVFTGGISLFESKRHLHNSVHAFPSGVDAFHFRQARKLAVDHAQQYQMVRPRLGYAGVIDERIDLALIDTIAKQRPSWDIVMIGPTAKISTADLPQRPNIHWIGMKAYADLPKYFAGWDVGIMPFALNDSTRFISPTKTPEYLAAGLPVVSTPIRDVVRPYEHLGLVRIAKSPGDFITAVEQAIALDRNSTWQARADEFLKGASWDSVWDRMNQLIAIVPARSEVDRG